MRRLAVIIATFALVTVTACSSNGSDTAAGPTTTAGETATTTAAAPFTPAGPGDHAVGATTITLDDDERPLTVDVWFPLGTDVDTAELPARDYTFIEGVYYTSPDAYDATADDIADEAFPLIVYSHGSGGLRFIDSAYTEALAAHGYIVVAADHPGNTAVERIAGGDYDFEQIGHDRPQDVARLIDAFTDTAQPTTGAFAEHVDTDRIVVTGHSLGGYTSVAMAAGARNPLGDIEPDERVDAIVALAPAISPEVFPAEVLARLDIPMLVIVGTDDKMTPIDPNLDWLWDNTDQTPAYRIELDHAEHYSFTDLCDYQESMPNLDGIPRVLLDTIDELAADGCSPDDMDVDRAHELTITYALAFLDEVLDGGPPMAEAVGAAPDDMTLISR